MSKNSRKIYFRLQNYEKWAKKYDTILPIIHTNLIYELFLNEFLAILNNNTLIRLVYLLTSEVKNLCRMRNSNSFIIIYLEGHLAAATPALILSIIFALLILAPALLKMVILGKFEFVSQATGTHPLLMALVTTAL